MDLLSLQSDPAAFRSALLIDTDSGPRPFSECMDDWQRDDFAALDSGWRKAAGQKVQGDYYSRAWLERPRGHSKTNDLAVMVCWALFASRRRLAGIAAAGDQDQARLLRDAISKLCYVNPWLSKLIEVQAYKVVNTRTESTLEIISSDAKTSYGLTPDFIICDEIVHWKNRDLWDSLLSSAAKRKNCMLVLISNAGLQDDWTWETREAVRSDPKWLFSRLEGPVASWIDESLLDEQRRLLPSIAFRRLWLNEWTSGGGDALAPEVIDAAFNSDLRPQTAAERGYQYTAGVDLGVSRNASAVVILGVRRGRRGHGRIRLAHTRIWKPTKGKRVDLQEVENALRDLYQRFKFKQLAYDPWEARFMASRLQSAGLGRFAGETKFGKQRREALPLIEVPPTGRNLQAVASSLIEAFNDYRVELFADPDLRYDLHRLRVEERSFGFRLTSPQNTADGTHGDMASAFGLALLAATELASKKVIRAGDLFSKHDEDDEDDGEFERRSRRYREEMEDLQEKHVSHHQEGAIKAMLSMGGYARMTGLYPKEAGGRL